MDDFYFDYGDADFSSVYGFVEYSGAPAPDVIHTFSQGSWPTTISGYFVIDNTLFETQNLIVSGALTARLYVYPSEFSPDDLDNPAVSKTIYPISLGLNIDTPGPDYYQYTWQASGVAEPAWGDSNFLFMLYD